MSLLLVLASLVMSPVMEDDIKLDLKAAKYKAAFDGGGELIGYNEGDEKAFFYVNGEVTMTGKAPSTSDYTLTLNASCQAALKENAKINVSVNGKEVAKDFVLKTEDPKDYEFTVKLKEGENKVTVTYTNDVYKENEYDRNFYLHSATLKAKK
jgi:hypothetical protein